MKRRVALVVLLLGISSFGYAGTCADTTLNNLIGNSCTLDGLTFGFTSYTGTGGGGATALAASDINVSFVNSGGEVGFELNASWNVGSGQSLDSLIEYTISSGTASINDLVLSIGGFGANGTGVLSVAENAFAGQVNVANLFVAWPGGPTSQQVFFTPVDSLSITKDISVNGHSVGSAALSSVVDTASQVPEPATITLLGTGLLSMAGYLKRRLKKS